MIQFLVGLFLLSGLAMGSTCSEKKPLIEVSTSNSTLFLCDSTGVKAQYKVAFGTGGFDKKKEGDAKTPLGRYAFGPPRKSDKFFIFIPIGYPTADQKKKGYTGRDVGLHGPSRSFAFAGGLNTLVNWTDGCVAVGTDREITEISEWVKSAKVKEIYIH